MRDRLGALLAEQTRVAMLVGVAVAVELARELGLAEESPLQISQHGAQGSRMSIRYLGHSAFEITEGGVTLLIDPFLTGNPTAAASAESLSPDVILLTHGHGDHLGDTVAIAQRTGATVVAIVELAGEISSALPEGHDVRDPNSAARSPSTGAGCGSCLPGTPGSRPRARPTRRRVS